MKKRSLVYKLLHTALLLLVLCSAGQVHNHLCFDGMEPASLVHFENLGGHPDHDEDEAEHVDQENEMMPQVLLTKAPDLDSQLFIITAAFLLTERRVAHRPNYDILDERLVYHQPSDLLPPAQGPPPHSC